MALYDHKQCTLILNGHEINSFDESSDCISVTHNADAGAFTVGANGRGVFVANGDESGTLTIKVMQHSADNEFLSSLLNQQRNAIKSFIPIEMHLKDVLNGDEITGMKGFFTTVPPYTRGTAHNSTTWIIVFERMAMDLKRGIFN